MADISSAQLYLLSFIATGYRNIEEILEYLPRYGLNAGNLRSTLEAMVGAGWLWRDRDGGYSLTESGVDVSIGFARGPK
jgi:DNA-binding transcriptional regulator PaaX